MARGTGQNVWAVGLAYGLGLQPVLAAELTWMGPPTCADLASVREEAERLSGRALSDVAGMDFHVTVREAGPDGWQLTLRTVLQDEDGARIRKFSARSCSEVTQAAAVAVALAIEERAPPAHAEKELPSRASSPEQTPKSAKPRLTTTLETSAVRAPTPTRDDWSVMPSLAGVVDMGALPSSAFGIEGSLGIRYRMLRGVLFGAAFPAQESLSVGSRGGRFELLLIGASTCVERRLGPTRALGCLGFEAGRLAGEGVGVVTTRRGESSWLSPRFEVGAALPSSSSARVFARLGAAVPLVRRRFVLDSSVPVHEPNAVTARGLVGVELDLAEF